MKKQIYIALFMLLLGSISAFADNAAEARKVLDKAASKINLKSGITANFSVMAKGMNHSGTIAVKGKKFCARTSSSIIWFDGSTQWMYNKNSDEVNVSAPSTTVQQTMNPYNFLNLYKSGYKLSMTKTKTGNEVHLVGNGKSISEMFVTIDNNYNLKDVRMKQRNQWIHIVVSNIKNATHSDSEFRFNSKDFPNAEVIDLR
jgi:outer membrane lipoprotein-sorting protein